MKKNALTLLLLFLSSPLLLASDIRDQARNLVQEKKIDQALVLLKAYLTKHPDDIDVQEMTQNIMTRFGNKEEMRKEYKEKYKKDPTALNGYLYLKLLEVPSEREKGFRKVIEKNRDSVWGYYGLANALLDEDNLEKAAAEAKRGMDTVKEPARLHYVLGRIYRRMEDYPNAALQMREYYKLQPSEDNLSLLRAYEWLEISHSDSLEQKFELAKQWTVRYEDGLKKEESIEEIVSLAGALFIYADNDSNQHPFSELLAAAQKNLQKQKVPTDPEEKEYYFRVNGAFLALQAWNEAKSNHPEQAEKLLKEARAAENSSETFYYSAITQRMLKKKDDALKNAIAAATYPPVYSLSKKLATELWREEHGSEDGLEAALHQQREEFAPQRKARVLSQMILEKSVPFEMSDPKNQKITNKDLSGKIVLMSFWAVWCPPCREELPHWNEFFAAHKNDPGVFFAAVGDEPWETIQNYMKNQKYSFPVYRNEKYWEEFKIAGIPTMVILDPSGKIRFRNVGFEEGMEYAETLQWQIEAIRAGK